jgi:hypothetical protein
MKVSTEDLVAVLRMIAKDLQSPDGVANVFIDGAANRMTLLANLAAKHVEEMEKASERLKQLEEDHVVLVNFRDKLIERNEMLEEAAEELCECAGYIGTTQASESGVVKRTRKAIKQWMKARKTRL